MDVSTHTKHDFIHRTPHTHTLQPRIRDFFLAPSAAVIHGRSAATRTSAPCSLLCCSKLSQLLSWAKLPSSSTGRHGCKPNLRLHCPSAACRMHAARQPRRGRCRSRCRAQTCERMSFSATAAAAAIARSRSSSPRFVSTTCAACKHPGEAQGESRHATEDRRRAREGLRFDGTLPRTSRSSMWMKSEAPTSLETELDLDGDSVAVAPALKSLRERYAQRLRPWPPADPSGLSAAQARWLCVLPSLRPWSGATTAGGEAREAISGSSRAI